MANQNSKTKKLGIGPWIKEKCRKFLVTLKRNPQLIPLAALTVSLYIFTFNLTHISNTTAKIYGQHMGLCAFVSLLFSILSYVCMFNAFPKRQKPNILLMLLLFVMYAIVIFADVYYYNRIIAALTREDSPIQITQATAYILNAQYVMIAHIITIAITAVCVALEPLLAKLFKKINTSIDVEDNGDLGNIDIGDED